MYHSFRKALLAASLFSTLFCTAAQAADKITINFDEANPPYMHGTNGEAKGIYPAIIKAVFAKIEHPVELASIPWNRAIADIDSGKAGLGGLYKNKEREAKYDFSNPIYQEKLVIYTPADKDFTYSSMKDLAGKTIGVVRGWSYGDEFDKEKAAGTFKTEEATGDELNIKKLAAGRVDAIIAAPDAANPMIKAENLTGRLKEHSIAVTINDTFLAFNKMAKQTDTLKKFNETLDAMKADGSIKKIAESAQ